MPQMFIVSDDELNTLMRRRRLDVTTWLRDSIAAHPEIDIQEHLAALDTYIRDQDEAYAYNDMGAEAETAVEVVPEEPTPPATPDVLADWSEVVDEPTAPVEVMVEESITPETPVVEVLPEPVPPVEETNTHAVVPFPTAKKEVESVDQVKARRINMSRLARELNILDHD